MKIAFIHSSKKTGTGAHFINDLIACKLRNREIDVESFYPKFLLQGTPTNFKGINNILFFYSLLEKRKKILACDIIQGTTYTPLAFLRFSKPVVSHFGSTTRGFLRAVPKTCNIEDGCVKIFHQLKKDGAIKELNIKTRRPLNDISLIEKYAAERADYIIATSRIVKNDLIEMGIPAEKIKIIHNAIEDYWFDNADFEPAAEPGIVFLGRIGEDSFTIKLKGIGRLILILKQFAEIPKLSIIMSRNKPLLSWLRNRIPRHTVMANVSKENIPTLLSQRAGSIALLTSRYEGFSLSLVEAMSQQLVPVTFPVGIAPEIIRDGENGYIVNNVEEAMKKTRLLLNDASLRNELSLNAKETARQFRSETLINQTISLYREILSKGD